MITLIRPLQNRGFINNANFLLISPEILVSLNFCILPRFCFCHDVFIHFYLLHLFIRKIHQFSRQFEEVLASLYKKQYRICQEKKLFFHYFVCNDATIATTFPDQYLPGKLVNFLFFHFTPKTITAWPSLIHDALNAQFWRYNSILC